VPARPTASSRSSVSGVATRVSSRTFAYESSSRARDGGLGQRRPAQVAPRHGQGLRASVARRGWGRGREAPAWPRIGIIWRGMGDWERVEVSRSVTALPGGSER
jgi:hypothetical protein